MRLILGERSVHCVFASVENQVSCIKVSVRLDTCTDISMKWGFKECCPRYRCTFFAIFEIRKYDVI